jgi:hypothetical protein
MHRHGGKRTWFGWSVCGAAAMAAVGCSPGTGESAQPADVSQVTGAVSEQTCSVVTPIVGDSLFVTNTTVMANFPLEKVVNQILSTGSSNAETALQFYHQFFDTLNTKAGGVTDGPHCDDVLNDAGQPTLNGFPIECPRQEGTLASTNPFAADAGENSYIPIALSNRFDLAPHGGANCGEYRIVYGLNSGLTNPFRRTLIIFEAALPNPDVDAGLAGCLPVAQFWDNLSADGGVPISELATDLENFYFTGLPGFEPVVRAQNYGIGGGINTGQIRTNMFMFEVSGQEWELREFRLSQKCKPEADGGDTCALTVDNTFVRENPFGGLFSTSTSGSTFQTAFLSQVKALSADSVPGISISMRVADNAGESDEQDVSNNYELQAQDNSQLLSAVTSQIQKLKLSDLTADNILNRATTQSCAGCHELTNNVNIGGPDGGLVWPSSNGFTQISEAAQLSPALTTQFLPFRSNTLVNFITANCNGTADAGQVEEDGFTLGGSAVDSPN